MADTTINVRSGFYDAVDGDRTYSADDMNKPYKKVVSDGVFATPQGTPSNELQVVAGSGMAVNVQKGNGICAGKWFENNSLVSFIVPKNSALTPRIDSVIMQVDTRNTGRVGNLVYRTGTAASDPEPPEINTISTVQEYRLANITVAAGASSISDSVITDMRGSAECPWISALIIQPDTSTMWSNFYAAYAQSLERFENQQEEDQQERKQAWDDFFGNLTDELSVTMNLMALKNTFTASSTVTEIQIGIASYDPTSDILLVFINGLLAAPSMYTAGASAITLASSIAAGNKVDFVVLKSVVASDSASTISLIQQLDAKLSLFMSDSGWQEATLANGSALAGNAPSYRSIGGRITFCGGIVGAISEGEELFTVPEAFKPEKIHCWPQAVVTNGEVSTALLQVDTMGTVRLVHGTLTASSTVFIDTEYLAANIP